MKKKFLFSLLGMLTIFGLAYAVTYLPSEKLSTAAHGTAFVNWYKSTYDRHHRIAGANYTSEADTIKGSDLAAVDSAITIVDSLIAAGTKTSTEPVKTIINSLKASPWKGTSLAAIKDNLTNIYKPAAQAAVDNEMRTVLAGYKTRWNACVNGTEVAEEVGYNTIPNIAATAKTEFAEAIKNLTAEKTAKLMGTSYPTAKLLELTMQAWNYVVVTEYSKVYFVKNNVKGVLGNTWKVDKDGLENGNPGKDDLIDDYAKIKEASDNYPVVGTGVLANDSEKIYTVNSTNYSAEGLMPKFKAALDAKLVDLTNIKNGDLLKNQIEAVDDKVIDHVLALGEYKAATTIGSYDVTATSDYAALDSLNTLWGKVTQNGVVIAGVPATTAKYISLNRAKIDNYLGIYAAMKAAVGVLEDAAKNVYGVATEILKDKITATSVYGTKGADGDYANYLQLQATVNAKTYTYDGTNYLEQVLPVAKVKALVDEAKTKYQAADLDAQADALATEFLKKPAFGYTFSIDDALLNAKGVYPVAAKLKNINSTIKALKALYVDNEKDAANKGKVDKGDKTSLKNLSFTAPKCGNTEFAAEAMTTLDMITLGSKEQAILTNATNDCVTTLNSQLRAATMYTLSIDLADEYKATYDEIVNATLEAPSTTYGIRDEKGQAQYAAIQKANAVYSKFGAANAAVEYDGKHVVEGGVDDVVVTKWYWDYDSISVKSDATDKAFGTDIQKTVKQLVDSTYKANGDKFVAVKYNASKWLNDYAYGEFSLYKQVYGLDGIPENLTADVAKAIKAYTFKAYDEAAWIAPAKAVYDELQRVNGYITADKLTKDYTIYVFDGTNSEFNLYTYSASSVDNSFITLGEKLDVAKNELAWVDQQLDSANIALLPANVIVKNKDKKWTANKIELTEGAAANYWTVAGDVIANTVVYNKEVFQVKSPFYLPFTVSVDDLKKAMGDDAIKVRKFNAAYVKEGTNELYLNWAVTETLYANMPYQVENGTKLAEAKNVALTFENVVLAARNNVKVPTDGSVESSTVDVVCTLAGVSMPLTITPMGETDAETNNICGQYRLSKSTGAWGRIAYKNSKGFLQAPQKAVIGSVVLTVASKTGAPVDYVIRNSYDGVEEEATAIEAVSADAKTAEGIYTISGQKVNSMAQPGLYIVNGKKVIKK